ncbi:MAG: aminoacyl-tRNA hydrolase [Polyangiaceae bacterium]|nr:aminoacyl-tRNA hydrolase [Polyangiaceae bacterium]
MFLVVGLGNPGKAYASHRHNVGFMVVEDLASRVRADSFREKFSGLVARATLGDEQAMLLEPQTYMNQSGRSVQPALAFHKIAPTNLIVVHDELDLPFGQVRLKVGGGHAGHNGLRSIVAHVGTGDFIRLRVGIGRPPPGFQGEVADYVLSSFDAVERANLPDILKLAAETVLEVAARGVAAAMNVRNARPKTGKKQAKDQGEGAAASEPVASPGQTISVTGESKKP